MIISIPDNIGYFIAVMFVIIVIVFIFLAILAGIDAKRFQLVIYDRKRIKKLETEMEYFHTKHAENLATIKVLMSRMDTITSNLSNLMATQKY